MLCMSQFFIAFQFDAAGTVRISRPTFEEVVDTSQLGSTIMETMLKEVSNYCNPKRRRNWSATDSSRLQVQYKCADS